MIVIELASAGSRDAKRQYSQRLRITVAVSLRDLSC